MHPFARSLLFTSLLCLIVNPLAQAQLEPAETSSLLETSALPNPDDSASGYLPQGGWTQRGLADYVGGELGVVGLVREKPNSQVIATDQDSNVLLDADELQGDMQFGVCAKLDIYQITNAFGGTDLQLGYWGINSMDATRTVTAQAVDTNFFMGTGSGITTFNYIYSSNLYSGEANFRLANTRRFRPLIGMRYLKLEDTFDQFDFSNGGRLGYFSLTNNSLFGAQLGLEATLLRFRSWDWFAVGKYGAMHNRVEGTATADAGSGNDFKNYDGSSYCSLIDGQTGLIFRYVDALHFKAAYQALYCSDVASGIDQSGAINFFGTPDEVVFDSRFWHGVSLTATVSF